MGDFDVKVKVASLSAPARTEELSLLVDTGATLSWIPRSLLEKLGVTPFSRLPFTLADGRRLERDITSVLLTIDGRKAPVEVAFGEAGEEAVLGATALEGLGFMVDPIGKKLVPRDLRALMFHLLKDVPGNCAEGQEFKRCPPGALETLPTAGGHIDRRIQIVYHGVGGKG